MGHSTGGNTGVGTNRRLLRLLWALRVGYSRNIGATRLSTGLLLLLGNLIWPRTTGYIALLLLPLSQGLLREVDRLRLGNRVL